MMLIAATLPAAAASAEDTPKSWPQSIQLVLDETKPLASSRGQRLPLYLWQAMDPGSTDEQETERLLKILDGRGVGLICSWSPGEGQREKSLQRALMIARLQTKMGLHVNVIANSCLYSFFNGDERTAHIDADGKPFWDDSFGKGHKMGCPFTLDFRRPPMRERVEFFAKAYKEAGVNLSFVFADWEIDGPIEFNRAHAASKRCKRCREHIKPIDDFGTFQAALRKIRSDLQRECYAEPIVSRFPKALVGNYAMYPHGGLRYWYDYFEYFVEGQPHVVDQKAKYRRWYDDFPGSGYTFAMPVVYTWYPIFGWYDFEDLDYRWFYNMLLVASNVGQHTSADVPIICFIHWHTTAPPPKPDPSVKQFSGDKYKELLWHMLLRGTDTFFVWTPFNEAAEEIRFAHAVYAEAQQYGEFLERGTPVTFEVPKQPAPVLSGLRLGDRVLVRRTEFGDSRKPITVKVGSKTIEVQSKPGHCQVLSLR